MNYFFKIAGFPYTQLKESPPFSPSAPSQSAFGHFRARRHQIAGDFAL